MLIKKTLLVSLVLAAAAVILAACPAQPTPDVNLAVQTALAQTRVAEENVAQAVAATLTASAPTTTADQAQATNTAPAAQMMPAVNIST